MLKFLLGTVAVSMFSLVWVGGSAQKRAASDVATHVASALMGRVTPEPSRPAPAPSAAAPALQSSPAHHQHNGCPFSSCDFVFAWANHHR